MLGAEFIDRGPTLNLEQLRFRIGNSEVHTNDTANPVQVSAAHFAVEIADWDEMIAHLDKLEIPYSTSPTSPPRAGEKSSWASRRFSGNPYTYVTDPNSNLIELIHHPLGVEDSKGNKVEIPYDPDSLMWVKRPEYDLFS